MFRRIALSMVAGLFIGLLSREGAANASWKYSYETADGERVELVTPDADHDLVFALGRMHTPIGQEVVNDVGGTIYIDESGKYWNIGTESDPATTKGILPAAADSCGDADAATTSPVMIDPAALPYDASFDASAATNNGDYRGSAADSLGSDGGKDTFWKFTPLLTGVYSIAVSAGGSAGVSAWEGTCSSLTEVGAAFNLFGGGTSAVAVELEAGTTYFIAWEDQFIGSIENEVRLRVSEPILPQGETADAAIDLSGKHWGLGFSVDADNSANGNALHFPAVDCAPDLGGGSGHGGSGSDGNDVWFKLPHVDGGTSYTLESVEGSMTNSVFVLYSHAATGETTADLAIEACNDDKANTGQHGGNDFMSFIEFAGDASRTYYLFVESYSLSGPGNGSFSLEGRGGEAAVETTIVENFYLGTGFAAEFIDTDVDPETPAATIATPPAQRIDRGFDTGKWGGYVTTGTLFMYNFNGSTHRTDPAAATGYMLNSATTDDETGSYFYTYVPSTRANVAYDEAGIEWVNRYGGAVATTTTLRMLLRTEYDFGHGEPGLWMISEPIEVRGLTGAFATSPVQGLTGLALLDWFTVDAPTPDILDALAGGDEGPITIGSQIPHGVDLLLTEINGLGFYIDADILPAGGAASGLFFDSIALTGIISGPPPNGVGADWLRYRISPIS